MVWKYKTDSKGEIANAVQRRIANLQSRKEVIDLTSHESRSKLGYAYLLSPKGISEKTRITVAYMKLKMKEYDELKSELKRDLNKRKQQ